MQPAGRQPDQSLRLAICETKPEDQEWLLSSLRAAGTAVRHMAFRTVSDLAAHAQAHPLDVIVWGNGAQACPLSEVLPMAQEFRVPVVVAVDDLAAESFAALRIQGVSDLYLRGNAPLATTVIATQASNADAGRHARAAMEAAADIDRRCDALIDAVADPVAYLNEGLHIRANQAYVDLMGFSSFEEMEGLSILDFSGKESENDLRDKIKRLGRGSGEPERMAITLSSGTEVEMMFSPTHYDGEPCLQVSVSRPDPAASVALLPPSEAGVAAPGAAPPSLEDWLTRDPATGLYTRQHFLDRMEDFAGGFAWAIRLDHHDSILTVAGPTQLDAMLGGLGKHLQALAPEGAVVARWTGALVGILSSTLDVERMKQLRTRLSQEFIEVAGKSFQATALAGGVAINEAMSADQVAVGMDKALGQATAEDPVRMIDSMEGAKAKAREEESLVSDIRTALEQGKFSLEFQPVVSLAGGPEAYEVLVRMEDRNGQLLASPEFLPLAATHGLEADVDRWVMQETIGLLAQQQAVGKKPHALVKVSASSLAQDNLGREIKKWLQAQSVPSERLWIEIPMVVASSNAKEARRLRDELLESGSQVMLSDFPMDPAAFRLVEALSPAWLKLDREFSVDLGQSHEKQAALSAVMDQAAKNGTRVLVGFVDDAMLLATLFSAGVDGAQGKFVSPPRPRMDYDFSQFGG